MKKLFAEICNCKVCLPHLKDGVNPVLAAHSKSKLLIIGQAPGIKVHLSSIPWDDASGDRLRDWLGIDKPTFYDEQKIGIIPMGFCYPGKGKTGDLPPRKECAPLWHPKLLAQMKNVKLTLLIGQYAQQYYLGDAKKKNLTATVQNFQTYLPKYLPLPHPSPRNNIWLKKNPWFAEEVLPFLKEKVGKFIR